MKPRPPTPRDYRALRRLHDAAGGRDELDRWIDAALKQTRQTSGRKPYVETFTLDWLGQWADASGRKRTALVKQYLLENPDVRGHGTEKSAIERVNRNLRESEQQLQDRLREAARQITDLIRATK